MELKLAKTNWWYLWCLYNGCCTRPNCGCVQVAIARSVYNPCVKLSVWLACCLSEVCVLLQVSLPACVGVKSEGASYCCRQCLSARMNVPV